MARPTHHLLERVLQPRQRPTLAISGILQQLQLLHQLAVVRRAEKTTGLLSTIDEVALAAPSHCLNRRSQRA